MTDVDTREVTLEELQEAVGEVPLNCQLNYLILCPVCVVHRVNCPERAAWMAKVSCTDHDGSCTDDLLVCEGCHAVVVARGDRLAHAVVVEWHRL